LNQANDKNPQKYVRWLATTIQYKKNYENFDRIDSHLAQLKTNMPETVYQSAIEQGKNLSLNDTIEQILETRESHHVE